MSIASVATAVLTLALWLWRPRPRWPETPMTWPWAAWLLALALSATFAIDPAGSWPRLNKALFPGLVALAAFHTPDRRAGRRALGVLLVSSAVVAVYSSAVFMLHGATFDHRSRGPVGHYMTFAGQLLLFVSAAVPVAIMARERAWRWGAGASAALGTIALAGTFTRSAWIGLGVSLAVILSALRPRWLPVLAVVFGVVYLLAPVSYRERLQSAFDPHHPMNLERTYMWDAGQRMFHDHPLTGVGLQDLHSIYDRYRSPQAHERAGHLHSVPVQIAATMGIVGLLAFAALYLALLNCAASGLREMLRTPAVETGLRVGVLAGLIGFLVAGLFEWNFGDEELLFLLFTLAGLAWSARRWSAPEGEVA
jgi:O-antigen ligase